MNQQASNGARHCASQGRDMTRHDMPALTSVCHALFFNAAVLPLAVGKDDDDDDDDDDAEGRGA